jgi:Phage P22-like portal protein
MEARMIDDKEQDAKPSDDEAIIAEAKERIAYWQERTGDMLATMKEHLEFSNPIDPKQWPTDVVMSRKEQGRPMLTMDRSNQFINQVLNDARQNKPSPKFLPADGLANPKIAEIIESHVRHIDYVSEAHSVFMTAHEYQVRAGLGYVRLIVKQKDATTNKQQVEWRRVQDLESCGLDPDYMEPDGSDAGWGFVYSDIPTRKFNRLYPKCEPTDFEAKDGWISKKTVRVCEYYRLVPVNGKNICESFLLTGEKIISRSVFPCSSKVDAHIPIIPLHGNEIWIEGERQLGGVVARIIGPQRAYNYERSAYVEKLALAPKAPFVGPHAAFEGLTDQWGAANTTNAAYLPYNHLDKNGQPIPAPSRQQPAQMESAWANAAQQSLGDISAGFGMFEANLGAPSNETSGKAIIARQHEGDTATFNFIDNLRHSIEHAYKIVLNSFAVTMDIKQIVRLLSEDNKSSFVTVDPEQEEAYMEGLGADGKKVISINPNIGEYDLIVTTAPGYATRQQETVAALTEMTNGNPQMFSLIGDVIIKAMNLPDGDKVVNRLKLMLPPQIQEAEKETEGQDPAVSQAVAQVQGQAQEQIQGMQQQMQEMEQAMQAMDAEIQKKALELQNKDFQLQKTVIDAKRAEIAASSREFEGNQTRIAETQQRDDVVAGAIIELSQKVEEIQELQLAKEQFEQEEEMKENATVVDAIQDLAQSFTSALQEVQDQNLTAMETMTKAILAPRTASVKLPNSGNTVTVQSVSTVNLQ